MAVMDGMIIVIEEQQSQRTPVFDDDCSRRHTFVSPVFKICADFQNRQGEIGRQEIEPDGHIRDINKPEQNREQAQGVEHIRPQNASIALKDRFQVS